MNIYSDLCLTKRRPSDRVCTIKKTTERLAPPVTQERMFPMKKKNLLALILALALMLTLAIDAEKCSRN